MDRGPVSSWWMVVSVVHPGQSSTAFGGVEHRFPAVTAEQIVDIPVLRGGGKDPDLPSAASSSGLPGTANQGVFRTFPVAVRKKVRGWVRTRGRNLVRTSVHPRRRFSWRVSSRMQLAECGCSSLMVVGNFWARSQKLWWLG